MSEVQLAILAEVHPQLAWRYAHAASVAEVEAMVACDHLCGGVWDAEGEHLYCRNCNIDGA